MAVRVLDRSAVWDGLTGTTSVMSGALFLQTEAGIRVRAVTGVQAWALPIADTRVVPVGSGSETETELATEGPALLTDRRSEERRVGKEWRGLWVLLIDKINKVLTVGGAVEEVGVGGAGGGGWAGEGWDRSDR